MLVMCHKPAQKNNMSRMNCDTIYITTYNGQIYFKVLIQHLSVNINSMK